MEYKNDWKEVKVSNLGQIITGKTPSTKKRSNFGGSIPFLTPSDDMNVRYVQTTARTLSQEGVNEVANKILPANSVCVSCIGSQLGKVVITTKETVTNQQINSIVPSSDVDTLFLYYLMLVIGNRLNYLSKTSTAVPIINKTEFSDIKMMLPAMHIQVKISSILSCLDSKIELNNKIIANLEAQAQAIFKSWFIDFEPFQDGEFIESELGLIPEGWEIKKLGDLFRFVKGKKVKEELQGDCLVHYLVKGVVDGTEEPIFVSSDNAILIDSLDPFMLMDGANSGNIYYGFKGALGSTFSLLEAKTEKLREIIYWFLKLNEVIIKNQNTGSAIPHANKDFINSMLIVLPDEKAALKVVNMLQTYREKTIKLKEENTTLAQIRDTLLPKLMSGEIDVSNIKIDPEEICHV